MEIPKALLEILKQQCPQGSRIRLKEMATDPNPLPPGSKGVLDFIDDIGTFHVKWENGQYLGLVPGEDHFIVTPPPKLTMKLYMPIKADLIPYNEYGDLDDEASEYLNGRDLLSFSALIKEALEKNRMPEEEERGLMHWYGEVDSIEEKVDSVVFKAEERDGQLWGVAECKLFAELTPEELVRLKEYISGQASDGWGEGFEQREIKFEEGEMYVHLWDFEGWEILTEEECFAPKYADGLPPMCFSTLKSTGELICIKRGQSGYYPSDWSTKDPEQNKELADYNNTRLGVTAAQRAAMEVGSMMGWDAPGADPQYYEAQSETGPVQSM